MTADAAASLDVATRRAALATRSAAGVYLLALVVTLFVIFGESGIRMLRARDMAFILGYVFVLPALLFGFSVPLRRGRFWAGVVVIVLATGLAGFGGLWCYAGALAVTRPYSPPPFLYFVGLAGVAFVSLGVGTIVCAAWALSAIRRHARDVMQVGFAPIMPVLVIGTGNTLTSGAAPPGPDVRAAIPVYRDPGAQPPA